VEKLDIDCRESELIKSFPGEVARAAGGDLRRCRGLRSGAPVALPAGGVTMSLSFAQPSALAFLDSGISVKYSGSKRERAFLGLRVGRQIRVEAGETIDAETTAPDFGAELMDELLG
jgi:hypothetical protein